MKNEKMKAGYSIWLLRSTAVSVMLAFAIAVSVRQVVAGSADDVTIEWKKLGEDLDYSRTVLGTQGMFSSELDLVRTSLQKHRIGVIRASEYGYTRSTVRTLCEKSKAVACINANFFDESGKPLGLIVSRAMTIQSVHKGGKTLTGLFQVTRSGVSIINRLDFDPRSVVEAVQAGPRLIDDGKLIPGLRESSSYSRRSGVCVDRNGNVVFFLLSAGIFGLSLDDLRSLLITSNIGCSDALNLDGGGSAQLYIAPPLRGTDSRAAIYREGTDEVPVALGLFLKGNTP